MGANASFSIPLDKAIMNWFIKKRGRAVSFISASTALAAVTMLPIVAWLVSTQGWRMTCVIAGVVIWIIGLPVAWFFIRQHRPEYYGLLPDGVTTEDPMETTQMIDKALKYATEVEEMEFTLRQAMKTPAYWLLIVATAGLHLVGQVLIIHAVPFVTDMGVEPVKAAVMIGIMTAGNIPGTFIGGFLADHIKKQHLRFLVGGTYLLQIIGFSAFLLNRTLAMAYLIFILHHFSMGICSPLSRVMPANYFGRKAFGSIRGTLLMFILPVSVMSPIYAGWVYDTTGSYVTVFFLCAVVLVLSTIIMFLAYPPKPSAQITDIHRII
jgi:sugar phosphate permease